jgi:hypothetical protein
LSFFGGGSTLLGGRMILSENRFPLFRDHAFCFAHDLLRKPVPTFRDHAPFTNLKINSHVAVMHLTVRRNSTSLHYADHPKISPADRSAYRQQHGGLSGTTGTGSRDDRCGTRSDRNVAAHRGRHSGSGLMGPQQ